MLVAAAPLAVYVELGGVRDGHHGHYAALHRVADDEVGGVRDAAGHVEARAR